MQLPMPPPPQQLEHLTSRIGAESTLRLIELHGGVRIHVPKRVTARTKLAREIGEDAARALSAHWGGDFLSVPLAREWRARVYKARGASYSVIARRLQVTEHAVWRILNRAGMTEAQGDLFAALNS